MRKIIRLKSLEAKDPDAVAQLENLKSVDQAVIIVTGNIQTATIANLQKRLVKHPKVEVIVNWEEKAGKNLNCLGELGFAKVLRFQFAYDLNSLAFLPCFTNLEELYLSDTKCKKIDISAVAQLPLLKILKIEGAKKGLESLVECRSLDSLELVDLKLKDISFLAKTVRHLDIKLGTVGSFDAVTETKLISLSLYKLTGLKDLSFVSNLTHLQLLQLETMKSVEHLPNFSLLKRLRRISINQMKGINDLSPLLKANALTDLIMEGCDHLSPSDFFVLQKHHCLQFGRIALVNKAADAQLAKILPLKPEKNPFIYV